MIETSATKKLGIEDLLERVWLETEVLDLKANPERKPEGVVIEAEKSGQRGIVATLLVQKGTLRRGDIILAGAGYGRVRNLSDDRGRNLDEAGPSLPVEVTGLSELPSAGDHFVVVEDLQQAADAAGERARKLREVERAGASREAVSLSNLFSRIKEGQTKEVKIVLKADVGGSLEVLKKELGSLTAKDSKGNEIQVRSSTPPSARSPRPMSISPPLRGNRGGLPRPRVRLRPKVGNARRGSRSTSIRFFTRS